MEQAGKVKAREGPFETPLGRGKWKFKDDEEGSLDTLALGLIMQRIWGICVKETNEGEMVGKSPLSREGSHEGRFSSRLGGDRGARGSGLEDVVARINGQGEEHTGERWFC